MNPPDQFPDQSPAKPQSTLHKEWRNLTAKEQAAANLLNAIKTQNEDWAITVELLSFQAKRMKAKYDALIGEGFTEQQALSLCSSNWSV